MSPKLFRDVEFVGDSCDWPKEEEGFCPKEVFWPKALVWPKDEDGFCPNEDEGLLEPVAVDGRPNGMGVETKVSSSSNAASRQYDRRTSSNSTHSGSLSGNHQSPSRTDCSCDVSCKTKMGGMLRWPSALWVVGHVSRQVRQCRQRLSRDCSVGLRGGVVARSLCVRLVS
jgi:hypothetical protein